MTAGAVPAAGAPEAGTPSRLGARIGVLLAAGRSTRMGRPKLVLAWPPAERGPERGGGSSDAAAPGGSIPRTIIGHVHDALAAWCTGMVVVLGAEADDVRQALGARPRIEVIGDGALPMFDSVRRGLLAARERHPDLDLVLLAPADHVGVDLADIGALVLAATRDRAHVHIPQAGERGGHPVAIPAELIPAIVAWPGDGGLAALWRARPDLVLRHAGAPPGVDRDIDTPEDYRRGTLR